MMKKATSLSIMQRAIRVSVCPICFNRPPKSEGYGADVPRTCEPQCTIFQNLPSVKEIVDRAEPSAGVLKQAVQKSVCPACQISPAPGNCCPNRSTDTCPLGRYRDKVADILGRIELI